MTQISKNLLLSKSSFLSEEEMKDVKRGGFRCCCGQGSDGPCFDVDTDDETHAIDVLIDYCEEKGYFGGGCFLNS